MTSNATSNTNNGNSFMVGTNTVIVPNTQHSLKLTYNNYPAWHVQMNDLFIGYDLSGFIDGTKPCPAATDPNFSYWTRQDQLILHAIIISIDPSIVTALGIRTIPVYLHGIKAIVDELALINPPLDDVDLVIHTLNGLGSEYREITTVLRTRENPISFEDLHDLLFDFENYLKREETMNENTSLPPIATSNAAFKGKPYNKNRGPSNYKSVRPTSPNLSCRDICQYCDKPGHTAKICYKLRGYPKRQNNPMAHHARTTSRQPPQDWIMDSGATHHITNALDNLHFNNQYHGSDELLVGDGSGLPIMHTGKTSSQPLKLSDDLKTRDPLIKGHHKEGLYILHQPPTTPAAFLTTSTTPPWHYILAPQCNPCIPNLYASAPRQLRTYPFGGVKQPHISMDSSNPFGGANEGWGLLANQVRRFWPASERQRPKPATQFTAPNFSIELFSLHNLALKVFHYLQIQAQSCWRVNQSVDRILNHYPAAHSDSTTYYHSSDRVTTTSVFNFANTDTHHLTLSGFTPNVHNGPTTQQVHQVGIWPGWLHFVTWDTGWGYKVI
ncbi:hypothetical protein TSUD_280660 [Trifolium subterraneum]|uniref:Retrotransposon Copia-like N-terminal domain-containing protein n=1 Tax=Trifolium subterraneum TaxID=3900 RepID=A0A2Z6PJB6_TRISU|nr:hypothetical protein TSUD_280660 [Trifolium subterraneum]